MTTTDDNTHTDPVFTTVNCTSKIRGETTNASSYKPPALTVVQATGGVTTGTNTHSSPVFTTTTAVCTSKMGPEVVSTIPSFYQPPVVTAAQAIATTTTGVTTCENTHPNPMYTTSMSYASTGSGDTNLVSACKSVVSSFIPNYQ